MYKIRYVYIIYTYISFYQYTFHKVTIVNRTHIIVYCLLNSFKNSLLDLNMLR